VKEYQSLSHTRWDCKYHVVFIPEAPQEVDLRGTASASRGSVPRAGAAQRGGIGRRALDIRPCADMPEHPAEDCRVERGRVHEAITLARKFMGRERNFTGEVFWARGYFVSTVGLNEEVVRAYIRQQEAEDERYDQMKLKI